MRLARGGWRGRIARLAAGVALASVRPAVAADRGSVAVVWENDAVTRTDRAYSNGFGLGGVSRVGGARGLARALLGARPEDETRWGARVGHAIYTPAATWRSSPPPRQHPYAGWTFAEAVTMAQRPSGTFDRLGLTVGLVGPAAQGAAVQGAFHAAIGDPASAGWHAQLPDELGVRVDADRTWRAAVGRDDRLAADVLPFVGAALGTVRTEARAGLRVRVGRGLSDTRGALQGEWTQPMGGYVRRRPLGWWLSAGASGRAVARDLFLDGSTWRDSARVDKEPFVGSVEYGLGLQVFGLQVAYGYAHRTRAFVSERGGHAWGTGSVALAL